MKPGSLLVGPKVAFLALAACVGLGSCGYTQTPSNRDCVKTARKIVNLRSTAAMISGDPQEKQIASAEFLLSANRAFDSVPIDGQSMLANPPDAGLINTLDQLAFGQSPAAERLWAELAGRRSGMDNRSVQVRAYCRAFVIKGMASKSASSSPQQK